MHKLLCCCCCRRRHTADTLRVVLPWLRWSGYEVVTLSEAYERANFGTSLTAEALSQHNAALAVLGTDDEEFELDKEALRKLAEYDAKVAKVRCEVQAG